MLTDSGNLSHDDIPQWWNLTQLPKEDPKNHVTHPMSSADISIKFTKIPQEMFYISRNTDTDLILIHSF